MGLIQDQPKSIEQRSGKVVAAVEDQDLEDRVCLVEKVSVLDSQNDLVWAETAVGMGIPRRLVIFHPLVGHHTLQHQQQHQQQLEVP